MRVGVRLCYQSYVIFINHICFYHQSINRRNYTAHNICKIFMISPICRGNHNVVTMESTHRLLLKLWLRLVGKSDSEKKHVTRGLLHLPFPPLPSSQPSTQAVQHVQEGVSRLFTRRARSPGHGQTRRCRLILKSPVSLIVNFHSETTDAKWIYSNPGGKARCLLWVNHRRY